MLLARKIRLSKSGFQVALCIVLEELSLLDGKPYYYTGTNA
jgi:hypothetical protein